MLHTLNQNKGMKSLNTIAKRYSLKIVVIAGCFLLWHCQSDVPSPETPELKPYEVTLKQATQVALKYDFVGKDSTDARTRITGNKTVEKQETVYDSDNKTSLFHIINYKEGGFMLVSADLRAMPVLAYGDKSNFDTKEISSVNGLSWWLTNTKTQLKDIKKDPKPAHDIVIKEWKKYLDGDLNLPKSGSKTTTNTNCQEWYTIGQYMCQNSIYTRGPLLTLSTELPSGIAWGQSGISNYYMPSSTWCIGSGCLRDPAGCGPVAMAQILWHLHPDSRFGYSSMPHTSAYSCTASSAGEQSLAQLMQSCGAVTNSQYHFGNTCNTLTYPWNIPSGLQALGLSNGGNTSSFNPSLIETEVYQGYPIIFYGYNTITDWHIWLCDGFKRHDYSQYDCDTHACSTWSYEYFYMNWGWGLSGAANSGTTYNGWYGSGNFTPNGTSYNFNSGLTMIKGIRK